jgi:hypothetical protein
MASSLFPPIPPVQPSLERLRKNLRLHLWTDFILFKVVSAVQIAAIFEFGGALLLGRVVTATIAGKSDLFTSSAQIELEEEKMLRVSCMSLYHFPT